MTGTLDFKKFTGEQLPDVVGYVKEYCKNHGNIEVMVGTDSQNKGTKTTYSTIIAMYDRGDGDHGHGAHCVFKRWNTPREKVRATRLLKEVEESINIAESLRAAGICVKYVDIDINPNPKFKSSEVYTAAYGWVTGAGFECRYKTLGPLITTLADYVVKS